MNGRRAFLCGLGATLAVSGLAARGLAHAAMQAADYEALHRESIVVDAHKEMGVGMIQLTYNIKNRVGDGASERTDSGLCYFGLRFVKRCNGEAPDSKVSTKE